MAELVDALDSKSSSGNRVRVRFPPSVLSLAGVMKLVDMHVSEACAFGRAGSTPASGTQNKSLIEAIRLGFFYFTVFSSSYLFFRLSKV